MVINVKNLLTTYDNISPEHKEVRSFFDGGLQIRRDAATDQLQARNNKRKIKRCAKLIKAHQKGEISLWDEDEEQRKEILHLFSTFHSPFVEILESLKDEETEEEA